MEENLKKEITDCAEWVQTKLGYEKGFICLRDCLHQWNHGGDALLRETVKAWWDFVDDLSDSKGNGHTKHSQQNRHGAWVPAIPL